MLAFLIVLFLFIAWPQAAEAAKEWYDYYQDGMVSMKSQKWKEAIDNFEKALSDSPEPRKRVVTPGNWILTEYYPYLQLGIAFLRLGDPDTAERYLNQALTFGVEPRVEIYKYLEEVDNLKKRQEKKPSDPVDGQAAGAVRGPPQPPPVPTATPLSTGVSTPTPTLTAEATPTPAQKLIPPVPIARPVETATPILTPTVLAGTLYVESVPSEGTVLLNGQRKGETPLNLPLLKEGAYEIEISKPGYPGYRGKVTIQANQVNKYRLSLGEYDCDYNSSSDRNPSRAINLENFVKSDQAAEVDYDGGDCTDWFSLTLREKGKWAFEIQLLDNARANIELNVYGPDSSTKVLGAGVRNSDDPETIHFTPGTLLSPGLYYMKVRAKGKGDRVLYKPQYTLGEEVVAVQTPVAAVVTPTPTPIPAEAPTPLAKTVQEPELKSQWPRISVKIPYLFLGLTLATLGFVFVVIFAGSKWRSKRLPKTEYSLEKVIRTSTEGTPAAGNLEPYTEGDDEILFLMKLDR